MRGSFYRWLSNLSSSCHVAFREFATNVRCRSVSLYIRLLKSFSSGQHGISSVCDTLMLLWLASVNTNKRPAYQSKSIFWMIIQQKHSRVNQLCIVWVYYFIDFFKQVSKWPIWCLRHVDVSVVGQCQHKQTHCVSERRLPTARNRAFSGWTAQRAFEAFARIAANIGRYCWRLIHLANDGISQ